MLTNFGQWKIKIIHISENTTAEGSVVKFLNRQVKNQSL